MPDLYKSIKVTQPNLGGPLQESLIGAAQVSAGPADAGKLVVLASTGKLDPSIVTASTVSVNGVQVANPDFNDATPAAPGGSTNVLWQTDGGGNVSAYVSAVSANFDAITTGTNTTATMTVGSGASIVVSGTGVVETTDLATTGASVNISNSTPPAHAGQLLISQPGNTTAVWADPFVQGVYPDGTPISTPINPVYIGGTDGTNLYGLSVDSSGRLNVNTTGGFTPALTSDRLASGTITSNQNVVVSCQGGGAVTFQIEGTWTGTLDFEATTDNANWFPVVGYPIGGGTTASSVIVPPSTAQTMWVTGAGGISQFRVRGNNVSTGTATVSLEVGAGSNGIQAEVTGQVSISNFPGSTTVTGTVIANQGTQGSIAQSWFTEITDGSNVLGTVAHPFVVNVNNTPAVTLSGSSNSVNIHDGSGNSLTSTSNSLNVNITGGAGTQTQYQDPTTNSSPFGTVALGKNPSNVLHSLSLDASGNLNVNLNTTQSVKVSDGTNTVFTTAHPGVTEDVSDGTPGSTAPATAIQAAGVDNTGHLRALSTDGSGVLNVNAAVSGSFTPALTADRTSTGVISANGNFVVLSTQGTASTVFNITASGGWNGTVAFQASVDGTNWSPVNAYAKFPSGAAVQTVTSSGATTQGQWQIPTGGVNSIRVIATAWSSGSITVWLEGGAGPLLVEVGQVTAANLNATVTGTVISNQGTQGIVTSPWFTAITDDSTSTIYGVSSAHPLQVTGPVSFSSVISVGNSTTTPLIGNATFTGTGVSTLGFTALLINSFSDKASTSNGLQVEQSQDGVNWDVIDQFTTSANVAFQTTIYVVSSFVRVLYTNTALAQATFRLQLVLQTAGDVTSRTLSALGHTQVAVAEPLPTSNVITTNAQNIVGNTAYPLPTTSRMTTFPVSFSSTGDNTIIAGIGGQTIRVWRILFFVGATTNITFKDGPSNAQSGAMPFFAGGALVLDFSGEPWYVTSTGNNWIMNQSGTAMIDGTVWFTQS